MSDLFDENGADCRLREGLRGLPVPETSANFEARIHAALRQPVPWWQTLWISARPLLSGAACSLIVTLILLPRLVSAPANAPSHSHPTVLSEAALDRALDSTELSAASLSSLRVKKRLSTARMPAAPTAPLHVPGPSAPDHSSRSPLHPTV